MVVPIGTQALNALREQSYDVVLDGQMPEMDGREAARHIREEWPSGGQPYVIALTAAVTEEDRRRCREAGTDDSLSKPLGGDALAEALPNPSDTAL